MKENDVTLTINIEKTLKKRFKRTALDNDDTMKGIVIDAILDYLAEFEVV